MPCPLPKLCQSLSGSNGHALDPFAFATAWEWASLWREKALLDMPRCPRSQGCMFRGWEKGKEPAEGDRGELGTVLVSQCGRREGPRGRGSEEPRIFRKSRKMRERALVSWRAFAVEPTSQGVDGEIVRWQPLTEEAWRCFPRGSQHPWVSTLPVHWK